MMKGQPSDLVRLMHMIETRVNEQDYTTFVGLTLRAFKDGYSVGAALCDEGLALTLLKPEGCPKIIFAEAAGTGRTLEDLKLLGGTWVKTGDALYVLTVA